MSTYDTNPDSSDEERKRQQAALAAEVVGEVYEQHIEDSKMLLKAGALATAASTTILAVLESSNLEPLARLYVTGVGGAIECGAVGFLIGAVSHLKRAIHFDRFRGVIPIE